MTANTRKSRNTELAEIVSSKKESQLLFSQKSNQPPYPFDDNSSEASGDNFNQVIEFDEPGR
jgi:hypothetical protein